MEEIIPVICKTDLIFCPYTRDIEELLLPPHEGGEIGVSSSVEKHTERKSF